jgi:hypothetical protein
MKHASLRLFNPQFALINPQFALTNPQFALINPQFALINNIFFHQPLNLDTWKIIVGGRAYKKDKKYINSKKN